MLARKSNAHVTPVEEHGIQGVETAEQMPAEGDHQHVDPETRSRGECGHQSHRFVVGVGADRRVRAAVGQGRIAMTSSTRSAEKTSSTISSNSVNTQPFMSARIGREAAGSTGTGAFLSDRDAVEGTSGDGQPDPVQPR